LSQVSTLWKINSETASELGLISKREFIKRQTNFAHPYYWASYLYF